MTISIVKATDRERKPRPDESELGFGNYTTDHMFMTDYSPSKGWHDERICPYQDLKLDPAALVLHYNQEIFEGLKAYAWAHGGIGLFRPEKNARRLNASAGRMAMPEINEDLFLEAVKALVLIDRDWLPRSEGTSLYIRPTMIANEPALGVRRSNRYLFYIIAGPVGAYYSKGFNPTRIYVSDRYSRAGAGGSGEAKTSGNYGPTLPVYEEALKQGYDQVLWLDAREFKYVEEVGTSNIFFLFDDELATPPLEGTILAGVIRDSVIALARSRNIRVRERPVSIDEVIDKAKKGSLKEAFATGTAAVVSPVGEIHYQGEDVSVAGGGTGSLSCFFYREITDIQYGRKPDPFGWITAVAG